VSRTVVLGISLAAAAAVGLGLAVLVSPAAPGLTIEIALFVAAALALTAIVLDVAKALPRVEPAPPRQPPRSQRLGQLESVARALEQAESSSFSLHTVLRPMVSEIASARLTRHGVSLERQPERARALLGAQTWELVRPDREAPARSDRGGCSKDELRAIVDSLETI
jgi:hypothetical protein